jgi:hypothetical protein
MTFHILAPQSHEHPNYSHAVILYNTEQKDRGVRKTMAGIFDEIFAKLLLRHYCFAGALH